MNVDGRSPAGDFPDEILGQQLLGTWHWNPVDGSAWSDTALRSLLRLDDPDRKTPDLSWIDLIDGDDLDTIAAHFADRPDNPSPAPLLLPVTYRTAQGGFITPLLVVHRPEDRDCIQPGTIVAYHFPLQKPGQPSPVHSDEEGMIRRIFEVAPVGMWFIDKKGFVRFANAEAARIWGDAPRVGPEGYDVSEAYHYPSGEAIAPEEWALHSALEEGTTTTGEMMEIKAFDGESRLITNATAPLRDELGDIQGAIVINRDITEERRMREALEESESLRDSIAAIIPDLLVRFDAEGRYLEILSRDDEKLLMPREELIGKTIADVLPHSLGREIMACLNRTLATKELQTTEYRMSTPAGNLFFEARMMGTDQGEVIAAIQDITGRKTAESSLREREEELGAIYDNAPLMIVLLDEDRRITKANAYASHISGLAPEEMQGMRIGEALGCTFSPVLPEEERPEACNICRLRWAVLDTLQSGRDHHQLEVSVVGETHGAPVEHHFLASTSRIHTNGNPRVMVSIIDVSSQKRYERELEYVSLHDSLTGLHNRAHFEAVMQQMETAPSYPISIICLDLDGLKLINDTVGHERGDGMLIVAADIISACVRSGDILARMGGDEFNIILPGADAPAAEAVASRIREEIERHNRSSTSMPLSISVGLATTSGPSESIAETLKEADDQMYRDKLHQGASARGQIVDTLLATLAERDYITQGHAVRLSQMSQTVGRKMGLSSRRLSNLSLLSAVHDLGKVGTPDRVLNKPGPLNPDEWKTMRQHPETGFRIASASPDLSHIADLILQHHEHWDGGGYPLGESGTDIPIECRIMAVVDAYDAMTHDRPYRSALSHEEAMGEIRRNTGTQFDPRVVSAFESIQEEKE